LPFDRQYYLGVRVNLDPEMTPRQPLTAVPYALNADRIDGMDSTALGDVTAVNPGTGLSGGGAAGDVTLSADTTYLQRRVTGSCVAGQSIRAISATGTVTCEIDDGIGAESDPVFGASAASGITGTNLSNWNTAFSWGNHASAGYDTTNDSWIGTGNVYMTTGNVGIGTSSPSADLHIISSAGATGSLAGGSDLVIDSGGSQRYITMRGPVYGQTGILFSNSDSFIDGGLRYWPSSTAGADRLELMSGGSGRLNVKGDGNIGIGTSSPSYRLHVIDNTANGRAVYGNANGTASGLKYGGYFEVTGPAGYGVYGKVTGTSTTNWAVRGEATGTGGGGGWFSTVGEDRVAVYGNSTGTSGTVNTNVGGDFRAAGNNGTGVKAIATGTNGLGLYASGGPSGYAAHFSGKVRLTSRTTGLTIMELGEGLDYAEGFDVTDESQILAGTVLIIDEENPGKLKMSEQGYDTRVAGIVAGANSLGSGVRLGAGEFDHDVALAGRVYCNVDATEYGIKPGDLLTTSNSAGYAMKAADQGRSQGAILGKAMESLEKGKKGQILVLVTLQ
jgi:hypothetical protein